MVDFFLRVFNAHLLQNQADHFFLVRIVVNRKIARQAQRLRVLAQHTHAERVERVNPHAVPRAGHEGFHALAHFLRGFVGKRYGQNPGRIVSVRNKFGYFGG